jgi:hypothetical protein
MTAVTRDEFEHVKSGLPSAAQYAESANQQLDLVMTAQVTNVLAAAMLSEKIARFDHLVG